MAMAGHTHFKLGRQCQSRTVDYRSIGLCDRLTPLSPVVSNGYTSKCSEPYWSNPPILIFDIRALWRSGLSARVPECQKLKRAG